MLGRIFTAIWRYFVHSSLKNNTFFRENSGLFGEYGEFERGSVRKGVRRGQMVSEGSLKADCLFLF